MDHHDGTHHPKHPPNTILAPYVHSTALPWFIGSLVAFFLLIGVALVFWSAANPQPTSGLFSTEGGHDPIRPPRNTRDELKFRGELTPPNGSPRR
jgi:hypothetical protein